MAFPSRDYHRRTNTAEPRSMVHRSPRDRRTEPRRPVTGGSSNDDVQLNQAASAWKPSMKRASGANPDMDRHRELLGCLRCILNKLTPERFESLTKEVLELEMKTEETLKAAAQLVFEKAVSEQHFSSTYADLCRRLAELKVPTSDGGTEVVTFRQLVIRCCQAEFEKGEEEVFITRQRELEAVHDVEQRELLMMELEEDRSKAKRRSLGNVRFIGELFTKKLLNASVIYNCLVKLLDNGGEDSLEGLCKLLTTAGKDMDVVRAKAKMDELFIRMHAIIQENRTSCRIQFLVQDVLDLRKNQWIPRREVQGPKRIQEIRQEAALEKQREHSRFQPQKEVGRGGAIGGHGSLTHEPIRHNRPRIERTDAVPLPPRNQTDAPLKALQEVRMQGGAIGGNGPGADRPHQQQQLRKKRTEAVPVSTRAQTDAPLKVPQEVERRGGAIGGHGPGADEPTWRHRCGKTEAVPLPPRPHNEAPLKEPKELRRRGGGAIGGHGPGADEPTWRHRCGKTEAVPLPPRPHNEAPLKEPKELRRRGGGAIGGDGPRSNEPAQQDRPRRERTEAVPLHPRPHTEAPLKVTRELGRGGGGAIGGDGPRDDESTQQDQPRRPRTEAVPLPPRAQTDAPFKELQEVKRQGRAIGGECPGADEPAWRHRCGKTEAVPLPPRPHTDAPSKAPQEIRMQGGAIGGNGSGADGPHQHKQLRRERTGAVPLPPRPHTEAPWRNTKPAAEDRPGAKATWGRWSKARGPDRSNWRDRDDCRETREPHQSGRDTRVRNVPARDLITANRDARPRSDVPVKQESCGRGGSSAGDTGPLKRGDETKRVTRQKLTTGELRQQLDGLLQDNASDRRIRDWLEANLDEEQTASKQFVTTLMTSVCRSSIVGEDPYRLDTERLKGRVALLQTYLGDGQKQLQAVYALQDLMEEMHHPNMLLLKIFDVLYDEDVINNRVFLRWEARKDADQSKVQALESVSLFFSWLGKEDPQEFLPACRRGPFWQRGRNH